MQRPRGVRWIIPIPVAHFSIKGRQNDERGKKKQKKLYVKFHGVVVKGEISIFKPAVDFVAKNILQRP